MSLAKVGALEPGSAAIECPASERNTVIESAPADLQNVPFLFSNSIGSLLLPSHSSVPKFSRHGMSWPVVYVRSLPVSNPERTTGADGAGLAIAIRADSRLFPAVAGFPRKRTGKKIQHLQPHTVRIDHIRDARSSGTGTWVVHFHSALAQRSHGSVQIFGPEAHMAEPGGALRRGWRQLEECVPNQLKIGESRLAILVFDRKCFAKAHRFRIEAHGLVEILRVNTHVIQAQPGILNLLSSARLHQKNSNGNPGRKQCETTDQSSHDHRYYYVLLRELLLPCEPVIARDVLDQEISHDPLAVLHELDSQSGKSRETGFGACVL